MTTYSISFIKGTTYMGISLNTAIVIITANHFADVVNIIHKRMSKRNENILLNVESIMKINVEGRYGSFYNDTIKRSIENKESICTMSIFDL